METSGNFLCPKCGSKGGMGYDRWIKKNNKWTFSLWKKDKERWTNAEYEKTRAKRLDGLREAISSIQDQFMTLNASEREEDCKPYEQEIDNIYKNYQEYYKDSPQDLVGSTIEEWDEYQDFNWRCYKCKYNSPTFLDFISKE